jgi:hypothetical protein
MTGICTSSGQTPWSLTCCKSKVRTNTTLVVTGDQRPDPDVRVAVAVATVPAPQFFGLFRSSPRIHPPGEFLLGITVLRV